MTDPATTATVVGASLGGVATLITAAAAYRRAGKAERNTATSNGLTAGQMVEATHQAAAEIKADVRQVVTRQERMESKVDAQILAHREHLTDRTAHHPWDPPISDPARS